MNNSLTAINGVSVGHSTNSEKLQGCTVVVFDKPYPVSFAAHGGTPRLYDSEILTEGKSYRLKHAIFLADGAHSGLETASEVAKALREKAIGFQIDKVLAPSITGACVMSLGLKVTAFDPKSGYEAVQNASKNAVQVGNVGVGMGTSVGKFSWTQEGKCLAMKTGIGSSRIDLGGGAVVCALTVVNALGNVINPDGTVLAGNRNDNDSPKFRTFEGFSNFLTEKDTNTTISIVGTNVNILSQEDLKRIAETASHGQIRAINPVNTSLDGDTVFVFTTKEMEFPLSSLGKKISNGSDWWKLVTDIIAQAAARAVQESIYDACNKAKTIKMDLAYQGIIPSTQDYK